MWSYVDQLGVAVLTDDQTFDDPHQATDALTRAFTELRSAAAVPEQSSGSQNGIEHGVKQAQPIVGGSGQRFGGVLGMGHQPDDAAIG